MNLKVSELFYSLQGEGIRAGTPTIFIRLSGCKVKHACYASGIKCDTEFESGTEVSLDVICEWIKQHCHGCKEITWTGGEPTDQLTDEVVNYFQELGFFQTIETSGINPVPKGIDFVTVSPKVAEHVLKKNFPDGVDELRYVRHKGQSLPEPSIHAFFYFLSPHSDGYNLNMENVRHCKELCMDSGGQWRLSVQNHKIWQIL